jgi:hypothetical protein
MCLQAHTPSVRQLFWNVYISSDYRAGGSPAATHFSCFAKKSKQKKATARRCPSGWSGELVGQAPHPCNGIRLQANTPPPMQAMRRSGSETNSLPTCIHALAGSRRPLCRAAFSLGSFFWRSKRKKLVRRDETRHARQVQ